MSSELCSEPKISAAALADGESIALKHAVCEETCRIVLRHYSAGLRSIVLAGSMARGEATIEREADKLTLLGDADFFLVFNQASHEPSHGLLEKAAREVEEALLARGILAHIVLNSVSPSYLRRLPPHIATYELRSTGEVAWGDKDILSLIPPITASQISKEDAWRMLCNRLIEFLEYVPDPYACGEMSPAFHYATVKLVLDIATSYLVFCDEYEPSYQARAARIYARSTAPTNNNAAPLPVDFAGLVSHCTEWKLSGGIGAAAKLPWSKVIASAHALWRWELVQLTGASSNLSNYELWVRLSRRQSFSQRLRGWLSVARRCCWSDRLKDAPRWARLGLRATPRYWTYLLATTLLFPLAANENQLGMQLQDSWTFLTKALPVRKATAERQETGLWKHSVLNVVWNYREFLVDTLA